MYIHNILLFSPILGYFRIWFNAISVFMWNRDVVFQLIAVHQGTKSYKIEPLAENHNKWDPFQRVLFRQDGHRGVVQWSQG